MRQSFIDRQRAARLLTEAGLEALIVAEPEAFLYVTGISQGVSGLFRRAGAGFAILPADPDMPVGAVIGDLYADAARAVLIDVRSHPLWMENADVSNLEATGTIEERISKAWRLAGRQPGFSRPATFDLALALSALQDLLEARGLSHARLAFDLDFIAASDAEKIRAAFPNAEIRNGSPVLNRLRMVKTAAEIEKLALGAHLAAAGLRLLAENASEDHGAADLHDLFRAGVEQESDRRGIASPPSWDYISIGPDPWRPDARIAAGSIVKADVGCVIDGYSSDTSRNYVFGAPTKDETRLHGILEAAFEAGLGEIRPGNPICEAHRTATMALHAAGLEGFSRGHFGHGLGHSLFSEQWPFIAADEGTEFEQDMVVAFEVPVYVTGVGGFNLEDQILVTLDGHRAMTTLPRNLVVLG